METTSFDFTNIALRLFLSLLCPASDLIGQKG